MTKREMIDEILRINRSATPEFLAGFNDADLGEYLEHLWECNRPSLTGDTQRYERYFETASAPTAVAARTASRTEQGLRRLEHSLHRIGGLSDESPDWLFESDER